MLARFLDTIWSYNPYLLAFITVVQLILHIMFHFYNISILQQSDYVLNSAGLVLLTAVHEVIRDKMALRQSQAFTRAVEQQLLEERMARQQAEDLEKGTYFSPIGELWDVIDKRFAYLNEDWMNRTHYVTIDDDVRYKETEEGAANPANVLARQTSRTNASSGAVVNNEIVRPMDIFGNREGKPESAHLMPQSEKCSTYWFQFISWVLPRTELLKQLAKLRKRRRGNLKATLVDSIKQAYEQKCIHGFIERQNQQKNANVGVKHFPTNRIRLTQQKDFLDKNPCVFIIPIMSMRQVKRWNGEGYDAIVLAGNWYGISAATVYKAINASFGIMRHGNQNLLATGRECNISCALLAHMIGLVSKSMFNRLNTIVELGDIDMTYVQNCNAILAALARLDEEHKVLVPKHKAFAGLKIRKISFSHVSNTNDNPAPDPVLVLAKTISNWFKRHEMTTLPGCSSDSDDDTGNASECCSSSELEAIQLDWPSDMCVDSMLKRDVEIGSVRTGVESPLSM
jgi:hypothetical protein